MQASSRRLLRGGAHGNIAGGRGSILSKGFGPALSATAPPGANPAATARPAAARSPAVRAASPPFARARHSGWNGFADRFLAQPELLIRLGRLISSGFALLAVLLDPIQPQRNVSETYLVLGSYVLYSLILTLMRSRAPPGAARHTVTHAIDIAVFGLLSFLTGELASPFLAFVSFALITSAMRWGVRGALITALILNLLLLFVGWPYDDPTKSDLNGFIMRSAYAFVAAAMLGYFASYRDRSQRRLTQLAAWPVEAGMAAPGEREEPSLEGSLRHASAVLGGCPLLVLWLENDEPGARLAWWDGVHRLFFDITRAQCEQALAGEAGRAGHHYGPIARTIGLPEPIVQQLGLNRMVIPPHRPAFCRAGFASQRYRGCVFVIDPGYPTEEMLSLVEIVADRIAFELEQFAVMRELSATASWRARGRLARDLHDSVLQDLTAASLQIRLAERQHQPEALRDTLSLVGGLLQTQQRRIRQFVEGARPRAAAQPLLPLRDQLDVLADPLSRQWHCAVHIDVFPADILVPARLATEMRQIVSEATANAARHGGAGSVHVLVRRADPGLDMRIIDDGHGLADVEPIGETRPQSIRARVADLGGQFRLLETNAGLTMQVRLPL